MTPSGCVVTCQPSTYWIENWTAAWRYVRKTALSGTSPAVVPVPESGACDSAGGSVSIGRLPPGDASSDGDAESGGDGDASAVGGPADVVRTAELPQAAKMRTS